MNVNIILVISLSLLSCSKSSFSNSKSPVIAEKSVIPNENSSGNTVPATDPATGKPFPEVIGDPTKGKPVGEVPPGDPTKGKPVGEVLPGDPCKWKPDARILILDLKSGWFAGDGGNYYTTVTNTVCGGSLKVDYYHIEAGTLETNQSNISDILGCQFNALPYTYMPSNGINTLPLSNGGFGMSLTDLSASTNNSLIRGRTGTNLSNNPSLLNNSSLNLTGTLISANTVYQYAQYSCADTFDMSIYDEFWLLSGDDNDGGDLKANHDLVNFFIKKANEFKNKKPTGGFFVGAGMSNVTLGNKFIKSVFNEFNDGNNNYETGLFIRNKQIIPGYFTKDMNKFTIQKNQGKDLVQGDGLVAGTFNNQKSFLQKFGNFPEMTSVFDYKQPLTLSNSDFNYYPAQYNFSSPCYGDTIKFTPSNNANALILATDHCGQPNIAEFKIGGHKIVVDSNLARFYNSDVSYFQRIAQYLLQ